MSWNAFKLQMNAKMAIPSNLIQATKARIPHIPTAMDQLFSAHFDTATAGGKLIKFPGVTQAFKAYLQLAVELNRKNPFHTAAGMSNQIKSQALLYWTGRMVNGTTGITIVIFPGIWVPFANIPNLVQGGKLWNDTLAISLYIQKLSLLGVTISKAVPGLVTPWSGAFLQGLDSPISLDTLKEVMTGVFDTYVDLLVGLKPGGADIAAQLKSLYGMAVGAVFTDSLFDAMSSFPSQFGTDFNIPSELTTAGEEALASLFGTP